jgi:deoxyribose-phosphate aldolase
MENSQIASFLDLANHRSDATEAQIMELCKKVIECNFNAAFVNPHYIEFIRENFGGQLKIGAVVSFPLGQEILNIKLAMARAALTSGADELDVSLNVGYIKEGNFDKSFDEMKAVVMAVREISVGKIIKFIPENGYLTEDEIKKTAELILKSGADFYKACSGMGPRGATVDDVKIVRSVVGDKLKIKVAGGVTTRVQAEEFIANGADRIGTSHAVEIFENAGANSFSDSKNTE